ncbi:MAG: Gfo/Idh/MocA family oxidoreductase [Armatimonadetes bacterium]|nr:Gfo/Idh/MocA family oxidoreductase [Armatimonadota bacterium]
MKTIRIGVAGAGYIAGYHHECVARVYGVRSEVVGVLDVVPERSRAFAEQRGVSAFRTIEEMLEHVDVVDVCTPPYAHKEVILQAAGAGKDIICEKPLMGYAPTMDDAESFRGNVAPKQPMLDEVLQGLEEIRRAVTASKSVFCYAENCIYAPPVQRERDLIDRSGAQILRMIGEESHKGNLAAYSSFWKYACGGSLISTGSHPLGVLLYLKRAEGQANGTGPICPLTVSARTHQLTGIPEYRDKGFLRCDYFDVEDYGWMHVTFDDGTVGDVVTGATVLGGTYDYIEVFANNHRSRCRINPTNLLDTYNPGDDGFKDIYLLEMTSTQEGWSNVAPDEYWTIGYQPEMQDFLECIYKRSKPQSDLDIAVDVTATIYSAYLSAERGGAEVHIYNAERSSSIDASI